MRPIRVACTWLGWLSAVALWGCSGPAPVEVVKVVRGPLRESFREQCETRLRQTYPVLMPGAGRIGRISLEPGDSVRRGQVLVEFDQLPRQSEEEEARLAVLEQHGQLIISQNLEPQRAEVTQAQARLEVSQADLGPLQASEREHLARWRQARVDWQRSQKLYEQGALARQQLEQNRLALDSGLAQLAQVQARIKMQKAATRAAQAEVSRAQAELDRMQQQQEVNQARLQQARQRERRAAHESQLARLTSPIDGLVLERYQQGPGPIAAGEKLLLLGRLQDLEVMAEVLTEDAMRLHAGTPVRLRAEASQTGWAARVTRVEPAGFTKVSSLGVEQKRVKVILAFEQPPRGMGSGYRLEGEFVLGEKPNALSLPRYSVRQQPGGGYYCWTVAQGKLVRSPIELGIREDTRVEILGGLSEGQQVVANPEVAFEEGQSVTIAP